MSLTLSNSIVWRPPSKLNAGTMSVKPDSNADNAKRQLRELPGAAPRLSSLLEPAAHGA